MSEIEKKDKNELIRIEKENELVVFVNEYNLIIKEVIENIKKANYGLSKTSMLMKSTEREDFKLSLFETFRDPFINVKVKGDEFELVENKMKIINEKDPKSIVIIDNPLKLIKGGFNSLGIKESHLNYNELTIKLIKLINLRNKIYTLIKEL